MQTWKIMDLKDVYVEPSGQIQIQWGEMKFLNKLLKRLENKSDGAHAMRSRNLSKALIALLENHHQLSFDREDTCKAFVDFPSRWNLA